MILDSWFLCSQPASLVAEPGELINRVVEWLPAVVPGTVGLALSRLDRWHPESPRDLDAEDWWYRTNFHLEPGGLAERAALSFEGLATRADVWLNGTLILRADNMFRRHRVDVRQWLREENELYLVFRSLTHELKKPRERPRWKTNLVSHPQLRWHRTTLLGRIPGWSSWGAPVGPWRPVEIDTRRFSVSDTWLECAIENGVGVLRVEVRLDSVARIGRATIAAGGRQCVAKISTTDHRNVIAATLTIEHPELWWPHSQGEQSLYSVTLTLEANGTTHEHDCGKIGFREVRFSSGNAFGIEINGQELFCRGACWTISDLVNFGGTEDSIRHDLMLAREAGMNMVRVGGTMVYESDTFYRLCDELGIMVWQDMMFANMDYPFENAPFLDNVESEIREQFVRLSAHPCVVVCCGNSEIEQQIAMLGMPVESTRIKWFHDRLRELHAELFSGSIYVTSSPSGGPLPFHVRTGVSHFYGVGAYKQSPRDLRLADVKFTTECLGFANVPEQGTLSLLGSAASSAPHHPNWKRGSPRDTGAGWDFDDIRDFYLKQYFQVDPVELRSHDMNRYLQLSRLVTGEMMAQTFAEWRSSHGNNRGGLVWFFKDLQPGAGWGILDSLGQPKAAYYFLKRSWQPVQLMLTDERLDGLHIHVINETSAPVKGLLELTLLKNPSVVTAHVEREVRILARSQLTIGSDDLLGRFCDVTYSYRFGPVNHEIVIATLYGQHRDILAEAFYFVSGRELSPMVADATLEINAGQSNVNHCEISLQSDRFLQYVSLSAKGYQPDDNYFHLAPGRRKTVVFRPTGTSPLAFKAVLEAVNFDRSETIRIAQS